MRIIKIVKCCMVYAGIVFLSIIVHELGHGITAILFGGEFKGIWITSYFGFGKKASDIDPFIAYTITTKNGLLCYRAVKIGGSLTNVSFALLIRYYSKKRVEPASFVASTTIIYYELLYWIISLLSGFGDGYQFFSSFEMIDSVFMLKIVFVLIIAFILIFIILTSELEDIFIHNKK